MMYNSTGVVYVKLKGIAVVASGVDTESDSTRTAQSLRIPMTTSCAS